jgi:hypothetical protein
MAGCAQRQTARSHDPGVGEGASTLPDHALRAQDRIQTWLRMLMRLADHEVGALR